METNTENLPEETHTDASQLNAAVGDEAVSVATDSDTVSTDSLSLAEINEITGRNYKDKASALKSIREMQSQAGKAADLEGKVKAAQADPETSDERLAALQEQLTQTQLEVFYSQNPDVNRELAETIAKANGIDIKEAVNTDLYKNTVAKEPEKRTVATSNSRVAQPSANDTFDPKGKSADEIAEFVAKTYITN